MQVRWDEHIGSNRIRQCDEREISNSYGVYRFCLSFRRQVVNREITTFDIPSEGKDEEPERSVDLGFVIRSQRPCHPPAGVSWYAHLYRQLGLLRLWGRSRPLLRPRHMVSNSGEFPGRCALRTGSRRSCTTSIPRRRLRRRRRGCPGYRFSTARPTRWSWCRPSER